MKNVIIVADFDPSNKTHLSINGAIAHCGETPTQATWIKTDALAGDEGAKILSKCDGMWIGPGSPYRSMEGALRAIRWAREKGVPLLGTCGGFQHIILEYARHVLGITDAEYEESNPEASRLFISRLTCSLVGRTMTITLEPKSLLAALYGRTTVHEQYYCDFGVNPAFVDTLRTGALRLVASDEEGAARAVELTGHPFFIGTLFLPQ